MHIHNVASSHEVTLALKAILEAADGAKPLLLLLPGGSAAKVGVAALEMVGDDTLSRINVTLTDERYGVVNHKHSNWTRLQELGLSSKIHEVPVLQNKDATSTSEEWNHELDERSKNSTVIALFGIGTDFHIAGIKPGHEFNSSELTAHYVAKDF